MLGVLAGLIGAILSAMKPATDSLELRLKKYIEDEDLKIQMSRMEGIKSTWREDTIDLIKQRGTLGAGAVADAWIDDTLNWKEQKSAIVETFDMLSRKLDASLGSWMPLFDITVAYTIHFWTYIEYISFLAKGDFKEHRQSVAQDLLKGLLKNYNGSINEVPFYSLYLRGSGQYVDWEPSGRAIYDPLEASLMYRTGVVTGGSSDSVGAAGGSFQNLGGDCWNFAFMGNEFNARRRRLLSDVRVVRFMAPGSIPPL